LRRDAQKYLSGLGINDNQHMSLQAIYRKLAKNKAYRRRREIKADEKQIALKGQLRSELD